MANAVTAESSNDKPIASHDALLSIFHEAEKPISAFRVGAEMEKFGVYASGEPLPYEGSRGILALMTELASTRGWKPEAEFEGGPILALLRDGASVTLEPGSQFELSGAPLDDCHQIRSELDAHLRELAAFSERVGVTWLGLGFHPFASREQFKFVPKQRYSIMQAYLPTRGSLGIDMMLRTATVQANFDFSSEADAMLKMQVALKLAPLTTALFANSPFVEGRAFGGKSMRAKVWLDTDPDRSGLVPSLWKKDARYSDYVEWALDVPMFMFKRDGQRMENTGQTFRDFWTHGFQGHKPFLSDWKTHLNTLFPEVRLKNTIEVRGADSQGTAMATALPALWTGLFYDTEALAAVAALTEDWTFDEVTVTRNEVWRSGLRAPFRAGTLQPIAERVVAIAHEGLVRRAKRSNGHDESVHLAPLEALVARGQCPADALLEAVSHAADVRSTILSRASLALG
jgi:glutamate--cysteine ligase